MQAERYAAAMTSELDLDLRTHLLRDDGQEDVAFVLWRPSTGHLRTTAVLGGVVLPGEGDRHVHGNASFEASYFLRAAEVAAEAGAGLGLVHSHPGGKGWQDISGPDAAAERTHAAQALELTGLPLIGLTVAGDGAWSARFWPRSGPGDYRPAPCGSVRIVGDRLVASFNDELRPVPVATEAQDRAVSAWGEEVQATFARLRFGVVGAGNVGSQVAEALARTGVRNIVLFDFDTLKMHNLDRTLHAKRRDARLVRPKVHSLARGLRMSATADPFHVEPLELSVVEPEGFQRALDCDVLFSCVDRPWARAGLNLIAYAHLIPVVDGGVRVNRRGGRFRGAEMGAQIAAPGRACLSCAGQYDAGHVGLERAGRLEDPTYLESLGPDHPLRRRENVYAFGSMAATLEVLQLVGMVAAPGGATDHGAQLYHLATGHLEQDFEGCHANCNYSSRYLAQGDSALKVTGAHLLADRERVSRAEAARRWSIRFRRMIDDRLTGLEQLLR
jgi:hypothetical protein